VKSTRRLVTAEVSAIQVVRSRWRSGKKRQAFGVEIEAGGRRIRFGWELSWEEKYWLAREAQDFLALFAPLLRETLALEKREEQSGE
jgi:hypothetical protein